MFKDKELGWKEISILVLVAYVFSFAIRLIWVWQFKDNASFHWNNQLMINTNDGYFFASAVEYLLNGSHADNPRVHIAIDSYPGFVYASYVLAKYTPLSIESTILYLPTIISSLVVIPLILVGRLIGAVWVGFFAALLGSIGWSYYNRTMTGYYDTDMFSVLLQFSVLYFFLLTIYKKDDRNILWLAFSLLLYPFFYPQGLSLIYAIFILWVLYQLIFQKDEKNSYLFITVASIALWGIPIWIKAILIVTFFIFLEQIKSKIDNKKFFYIAIFSIIFFLFFGNVFGLIYEKIRVYMDRGVQESGLHFYQVIQTVREAGKISWETVANRIIGYPLLLALSLIGYVILVFKHRAFIVALPLIGVGVFAHWAGLRFTVYAVPVAAFSLIYLFYIVSKYIDHKPIAYISFVLLSLLSLVPNIDHIIGYKVPTVLNKAEVTDLKKLDEVATSKDYTIGWWDYGYPMWFYSDTSTLIDGAKHHNDNFIISKILTTTSQTLAANLSRLSVEIYAKEEATITDKIFKDINPNELLDELENDDFKLPEKTRDIYLYLPNRMLNIFPTVDVFSNLDLVTGEKKKQPFFFKSDRFKDDGGVVNFGNGLSFEKKNGVLHIGQNKTQIKRLVMVGYDKEQKLQKDIQTINPNSEISILYMQSYGTFLILDERMYNSLYIQLFVLENYDKNLFEPVVLSPYSKIYKIKK